MTSRRPWTAQAVAVSIAVLLLASACADDDEPPGEGTRTAAPAASPTAVAEDTVTSICGSASPGEVLGNVESPELVEISGLAASRANPGVLWAHNDSGGDARVYAMGTGGEDVGSALVLLGAEAIDWEDMAIGPGPEDGQDYLYVGDIGDNDRVRSEITVYRIPEPDLSARAGEPDGSGQPDKLTLTYPDQPHDAETLLVDPVSGDLFIVTKELETGISFVFRASGAFDDGATATLEQVAEIDFTQLMSEREIPADAPPLVAGVGHLPTAGDVSPGGDVIAIRTYATVWLWSRAPGSQLWEAFADAPCEGPSSIEAQGEAIAFDSDGLGYFTVSEGEHPPVNSFR